MTQQTHTQHGTASASPTSAAIDPATQVGLVALTVADLKRSLTFYTEIFGFTLLDQKAGEATLGTPSAPLLLLREETGLPVMVCDDPISAVVLGSGKALDHLELLKEVTIS